jgi:putative oxidoreductase
MKVDQLLNDQTLNFVSLLLLVIWTVVKYLLRSPAKAGWETSAATVLRVVCGLLLTGASLDKVGDPDVFVKIIRTCYDVLPASLVPIAAVVIPWLEFFTGVCLLVGIRWRAAALIFCALMMVYTPVVTWDLLHSVDCNCGCFQMDSGEKMSWLTVSRDILFLGMGFIVLTASKTYASFEKLPS